MRDPSVARPLPDGPAATAELRQLAAALDAIGYRSRPLQHLLALTGDLTVTAADLVVHNRRLAAHPGPLADIVALLALGHDVPIAAVVAALGTSAVDAAVNSGAIEEQDGLAVPRVRLLPHGDLWLAADPRPLSVSSTDPLYVTGINPPATLLAALTVRRDVAAGLDIGAGNGIQSLLLARHCDRVVATDVNPRALAFAAFNAALNEVDRIEFRLGSLFEPVEGERFDIVVSNPPYVISPEDDLAYRDSGREPGALCAELVGGVPSHLTTAGYATILASWPIGADQPWSNVPAAWLGDDCRAWLLQLSAEEVLSHARQWNLPLAAESDPDGFGATVDHWVEYAETRGIDRIGYGAVLMQRGSGLPELIRADTVRGGGGSASAHVQRVFAAADLLAAVDDPAIAMSRCQPADEMTTRRELEFVDGEWRAGDLAVELVEGVGVDVTLDPLMAEIFLRATSGTTVRDSATQIAEAAGLDADGAAELILAAIAMVRSLLGLGILTIAG